MSDCVVRALGANSEWIGIAAEVTDALKTAISLRKYDQKTSAALGKVLLCAAMAASPLKGDDFLSVCLRSKEGDAHLIASANSVIEIKASATFHEDEVLEGPATLTFIKEMGLKTPYSGTVLTDFDSVESGLETYYAQSEQILTRAKLSVSFNEKGEVQRAFGYLLQALPFASEETKVKVFQSFDKMLAPEALEFRGYGPKEILDALFAGLGENLTETKTVTWKCACSKEKGAALLKSLDSEELRSMVAEGKTVHITCGFCGKNYYYSVDEIQEFLDSKEETRVGEA